MPKLQYNLQSVITDLKTNFWLCIATEAIISSLGSWRKPYKHNILTGKLSSNTAKSFHIHRKFYTLGLNYSLLDTIDIHFFLIVHLNSDEEK